MLKNLTNRNSEKSFFLLVCYFLTFFKSQKAPAVLMYHSFDDRDWKYGVHPNDIEKQIKYIVSKKKIVSLQDIVDYHKGVKKISSKAVAVTIDDGYLDTYTVFFKLAKKYKIPFTLFLTTDLRQMPNLGNLPRPSSEHLMEMHLSGLVTFGVHGHSHIHFTEVFDKGLIQEEIVKNEILIQDITNELPKFVAYPSGRYDDRVVQYFRERKYVAGFTIHSGFISQKDNYLRLRRIEVSRNADTMLLFKLRLTPALVVYNSLVARLKRFV